MRRFAITADVALRLAAERLTVPAGHALVAPTLLRSDVLARLYADVRDGKLDRAEASARLDHLRSLRVRLLGDRVLQRVAWRVAETLAWPDTYLAEYVAAADLQADVLVTLDVDLDQSLQGLVRTATWAELLDER
jgi:predicted nucleic acid-binding protein